MSDGVLGKFLTSLLATRTVVFIGYSLRDDDFLQIYNATRQRLADFHRQAYFVAPSISDEDRTRLESMGLRMIQTDGEFFIAQLKEHAQSVKCVCADDMYDDVSILLAAVIVQNRWLRKTFSLKKQPQYLISSWYLDGLQHGLERILRLRRVGEYSDLHRVVKTATTYFEFLKRYLRDKKFGDAAYSAGFSSAMIFASQPRKRKWPPLFYYFAGHCAVSRSGYKRIVNKLPKLYKAPNRFLRKIANEYNEDIVLIHMAQLNVGKYLDELNAKK